MTEFKRLALLHPQALNTGLDVEDASSSGSAYSLLLVTPITGRMHQIRAHLNHIGHPLDGDGRYDRTNAAAPPLSFYACVHRYAPRNRGAAASSASRLFLHAASLCTSFATMDAVYAAQHSVWCVRAVAELSQFFYRCC